MCSTNSTNESLALTLDNRTAGFAWGQEMPLGFEPAESDSDLGCSSGLW
jgi:hypothetical protein